jgi:AcrR family transcriptional regulator
VIKKASGRSVLSRVASRRAAPRKKAVDGFESRTRRQDIVERAAHLMQERGYGGISAQHIADALEFSKANFFYHVKSKEELLFQIFVETLNFSIRRLEEIFQREDPAKEKLRAVIDLYVQLMTDRAAVMQVWFKEKGHLAPEHEAVVTSLERRIAVLLDKFYGAAIESGEFRGVDPRLAGIAMFGMCFALTRWPELRDEFTLKQLSDQMQDLACGALIEKAVGSRQ